MIPKFKNKIKAKAYQNIEIDQFQKIYEDPSRLICFKVYGEFGSSKFDYLFMEKMFKYVI